MNRDPQMPRDADQALLEHYRRHSGEQPSAELDARILAAARAAVQRPQRAGWQERLHRWLFGAGNHHRWGVAVAGVAVLGIGLSLTQRTFEDAPRQFDAPASVVPAPASEAPSQPMLRSAPAPAMAPAAPAEQSVLFEQAESRGKVAVEAESSKRKAEASSQAPQRAEELLAKPSAMADAAMPEPQASLWRLQTLQQSGQAEEARVLREELHKRYPQLDIDAELRRLQEKP
ncbi:hypothetical protein [Pseudomonas schmalbachii]|uniref:Anti-sigma factor n=1 Tax=Pseudomonas schmalbachii TaxID=2816993 RepID=A0ABS3TVD6_9PSED|nr:hypothetical protein [Pseudomonas schmalbachii]MBO3277078.1 hypothetical protein [Pseudomonas schmalbachii]